MYSYSLGDFQLENGQTIADAALTYVMHGKLNDRRDNAVLILPSLLADHRRHDFLIGRDQAFDPDKCFIIAANTFGNGQGSSPSNSVRQPGPDFPTFSIRDMVRAQRSLVVEQFGIERLLAVGGISMGGMQAYQWAVSYPDHMKGVVAAITMSRITPWVGAIYEAMRKAIRADPAWQDGRYKSQPEQGLRGAMNMFLVITRHWRWFDPWFLESGKSLSEWLAEQEAALLGRWDANNFFAQTLAEELHDIGATPGFDGNRVAALNAIRARVLLMPSQTDLLHPPDDSREAARHISDARLVEIPSCIGHLGGGGALEPDAAFMNREIGKFIDELIARP